MAWYTCTLTRQLTARERERVSERDDIKMDVLETAAMERSVKNQPHIGCLNLLLKQNGCPDQHLINPKQY